MSFWGLARPVLIAVVLAPALVVIVGSVHQLIVRGQSLKDMMMILVGSPIIFAFLLILSGLPSLVVTAVAAGGLTAMQRVVPYASLLLWFVGAAGLAYVWIALDRYPHGDGGTMQSLGEHVKATCAASVVIWCAMSASR